MRLMSAGEGYKYLLRTVAAGDGDRSLSTPLTRYYNADGTPPGRWMGTGIAVLGSGQLKEGDEVTEAQLQLLIGMGRDPLTGAPLGRAYPQYKTKAERVADRVAALDSGLSATARGRAVAAIEAEEAERGTRRAVAGYDYTFSIPKSASVLWAVADAGTQSLIVDSHHAAVAEVVAFMEREVAATRAGATPGDGAVAQVDVRGLIATAYDHYDSRAGDPHLHTHVVISNKVQTVLDNKWRSLDSRPMHAATVALSELHEAVFADHLTRLLGVEWETRDRGRDRNPAWAIAKVSQELVTEFSSRSRHIDEEKDRLIAEYVAKHGRQPSSTTIIKLRARATLATRPEKQIHSLAELTAQWRERAGTILGADATSWARRVTTNEDSLLLRADDVPLDVVHRLGESVVAAVGEKRSTWRHWNLTAEAARQTMGYRFASTRDREAIVGLVVDAAETVSLRLTPPDLASSPAVFRRSDESSVFRPKNSTVFSSGELLEAEGRLLQLARATAGPTVSLATVERILQKPDREGRILAEDQTSALTAIAVSGKTVDLLVGPAGAGKTTAMSALRRAWEKEHGQGSVVGLAPSSSAAQVLADDLGIATENTAKWWQTHLQTGETFRAGQLVIVDEASLAGTLSLDRIAQLAAETGAKVLLVGDYAQLQSVDAGGAFGLLAHDRDDVAELVDVHRFAHEWEKRASLDLRHGHTEVIDTYADHGRIVEGDTEAMIDAAYAAWRADMIEGRASVLVADSNESVTALNNRARTDLILDGTVRGARESELHDGSHAATGDTVITRRNDRRLRAGRSWVRNGDRWKVSNVHGDGSMLVRREGLSRRSAVLLPAAYVAEHVELGYAVTSFRAQGLTTDTAHVLVDSGMTRETLYVAMTRGRNANIAYVAVDKPDASHVGPHPGDTGEATGRSVLYGVLKHVSAELSAHETMEAEQETWGTIAQLAAEYETIAAAAQRDRWASLVRVSGLSPEQADEVIDSDAFGPLTAELRRAEANHYDVEALLPRLVRVRDFSDADDIAAVLTHRVASATVRAAGSSRGRSAPRLIAGLIPEATGAMSDEMRQALHERRELIEARADAVLDAAIAESASWVAALGAEHADPQRVTALHRAARVIAAYRDRYSVTTALPIGTASDSTTQKVDRARAQAALHAIKRLRTRAPQPVPESGREAALRPRL
ncbi:relaxase domain-containing protein [Microbacterium maritypicum]|uniref:Relaxase domain-containing protein n=2 Tax=Microbacterium maritypicum TaxID=33918 RepID=A0ACD4BC72_MICMQ|nr:MobF family relaxase [Microbacterium liquefaciens]UTT54814.1 relaxase domain-containing protein [Microbacterium liquefaciens]